MKLTKKQRNTHYKTILELVLNDSPESNIVGFRDKSALLLFGSQYDYLLITEGLFPEYFLFNPGSNYYWFDKEERIIALLFCIEMTN